MFPYWLYSCAAALGSFGVLVGVAWRRRQTRRRAAAEKAAEKASEHQYWEQAALAVAAREEPRELRGRVQSWLAPFSRAEVADWLVANAGGGDYKICFYDASNKIIGWERLRFSGESAAKREKSDAWFKELYENGPRDGHTQPLYDTITIERRNPNLLYRFMQSTAGKSDAEISPHVGGGGQLFAPKIFVIDGLEVMMAPAPRERPWDNAQQRQPLEELEPAKAEEDRQAIIRGSYVRLHIGLKDYWTGTLDMLPTVLQRKIILPPQQAFFVELNVTGCGPLHYDWRVKAILNGIMGIDSDIGSFGPSF